MILTTHIAIAAAAAKALSKGNPLAAFFIGIGSHYLADAVPHWHYKLRCSKKWRDNEESAAEIRKSSLPLRDYLAVAADAFLGALVVFLLSQPSSLKDFIYFGAVVIGGCFPDFLAFLDKRIYLRILEVHNKLHGWFHSDIYLDAYPKLGIPSQSLIFLLALWLTA